MYHLCSKGLLSLSLTAFLALSSTATIPDGYYSSCNNKTAENLLTALHTKIKTHTVIEYKNGLPELYATSDVYPGTSTIWDIYSTSSYSLTGDRCGNYTYVGDCWNREHSFPKSWFFEGKPMYSDAFHIYPTDGRVNGQRYHYPYGECANGTTLSPNNGVYALGRLGMSTFPGYSGIVFEPDDQYKGDLARSYFYMATCYYDHISTWLCDMLDGSSYPAFSSWALEMLLKWHRQDPVSQKEIDRNEAIYAVQNNRNPYIDHPELVEYIWGNHIGILWNETSSSEPTIYTPINGSTVNIGTTGINVPRRSVINVRGASLKNDLSVAVTGEGFSVSETSIPYTAANSINGYDLIVTFVANEAKEATGSLTISTDDVVTNINLTALVLEGLPAGPATHISDRSFMATWTNIDPIGTTYKLTVMQDGTPLEGYPIDVNAEDEQYFVEDLMSSTDYTYIVQSSTLTSNVVSVRTGDPIPLIELIPQGEIDKFIATPDEPSEPLVIVIENENIFEDILITVSEPFQVSTDKANWSTTMKISPDEEQFFVRLNAAPNGTYFTTLSAEITDYKAEPLNLEGFVGAIINFAEDFDADASGYGNYTNTDPYQGNGCQWRLNNAGIFDQEGCLNEFGHATQAVRFGKNANSSITMLEDISSGVANVKFSVHKWSNDGDATVEVQYSTNGGTTWNDASTINISSNEYREMSVNIGVPGKVRLRFQQTSGSRWLIDNVIVEAFSAVEEVKTDITWLAYSRGGELVIENAPKAKADIYSVDGKEVASINVDGSASVALTTGLYIVVINDTSRRVVVK